MPNSFRTVTTSDAMELVVGAAVGTDRFVQEHLFSIALRDLLPETALDEHVAPAVIPV